MRTPARLLASDLHSPGVDQSRRQHRVPMRFPVLRHEFKQPTQSFRCSAIADPHLESIRADVNTACQCDFCVGTVFPNLIRIFVVAMLTCVLTPVLGFVHATTQKCPRVHVLSGLPNCSFSRRLRDTKEHMLVDEQTLPSIANPSEAGGCNLAL